MRSQTQLQYKEPLLEIKLKTVINQYKKLNNSLPDFKIFYAVKCNPETPILDTLNKQGAYFEVASIGELKRLNQIGVDLSKVIYSNPVKPVSHIGQAFKMGIKSFSYDSQEELKKISQNAPNAQVYLRMNVSNNGSQINLSNKFGCDKKDAVNLIKKALNYKLQPIGITFHVGSQAENLDVWQNAINDSKNVLNNLMKQNIKLKVLNIGGGFPVNYGKKVPDINQISIKITDCLKKLPYKMELWCEPGRYLVADAGTIYSQVIGAVKRGSENWLYLDVGRFQAFIELFESEDITYPVTCVSKKSAATKKYVLTGPTCDSYDTIMRDVTLPTNIELGDIITFSACGAYTHVYGAPFNDFCVPKVTFV